MGLTVNQEYAGSMPASSAKISGGVAQLEERQLCKLDVAGSIPVTSIPNSKEQTMKLIKILILALILQGCGHKKDVTLQNIKCKPVCKPYAVSYVSAKNECVCDFTQLDK